jgi:hypothetical protein
MKTSKLDSTFVILLLVRAVYSTETFSISSTFIKKKLTLCLPATYRLLHTLTYKFPHAFYCVIFCKRDSEALIFYILSST